MFERVRREDFQNKKKKKKKKKMVIYTHQKCFHEYL